MPMKISSKPVKVQGQRKAKITDIDQINKKHGGLAANKSDESKLDVNTPSATKKTDIKAEDQANTEMSAAEKKAQAALVNASFVKVKNEITQALNLQMIAAEKNADNQKAQQSKNALTNEINDDTSSLINESGSEVNIKAEYHPLEMGNTNTLYTNEANTNTKEQVDNVDQQKTVENIINLNMSAPLTPGSINKLQSVMQLIVQLQHVLKKAELKKLKYHTALKLVEIKAVVALAERYVNSMIDSAERDLSAAQFQAGATIMAGFGDALSGAAGLMGSNTASPVFATISGVGGAFKIGGGVLQMVAAPEAAEAKYKQTDAGVQEKGISTVQGDMSKTGQDMQGVLDKLIQALQDFARAYTQFVSAVTPN